MPPKRISIQLERAIFTLPVHPFLASPFIPRFLKLDLPSLFLFRKAYLTNKNVQIRRVMITACTQMGYGGCEHPLWANYFKNNAFSAKT